MTISTISSELLESLAGTLPVQPPKNGGFDGFDIDRWIAEHKLDVLGPSPWAGGRRWIFRVCPWEPAHTDRSAYLLQFPSGAVAAGCHHNGCQGRKWHELRDTVEPGWRERIASDDGIRAVLGGRAQRNGTAPRTASSSAPTILVPLPDEQVEPFPVDVFPRCLQSLIHAISDALPCPPDFAALPMLAVLGTAIGTSRVVRVKTGWTEGARLYVAVVAVPGSKKTPALLTVMEPLFRRQKLLRSQYREQRVQYDVEAGEYESRIASWKAEVTAAQKHGLAAPARPATPREPVQSHAWLNDTTMEAIASVLRVSPRGVAFYRDELAGWVNAMDAYRSGKGADRQAWLSFWSGAPVKVDRKGEPEPVYLTNPFISVIGSIPPQMLPTLLDNLGREDGFVHRILFTFPEPVPLIWTSGGIRSDLVDTYCDLTDRIFGLQLLRNGEGEAESIEVGFTAQAQNVFVDWLSQHYEKLNANDVPANLRGVWSKLEGYAARFALILHEARYAAGETNGEAIDEQSAVGGCGLAEYFKSHARKVYEYLTADTRDHKAQWAVQWAREHNGKITAREVLHNRVGGVKTNDAAVALLHDLENRGYGAVENGHRGSIVFRLITELSTE